jgi:hypothetical protein
MELIKNNKAVIVIVLVLLVLILIRSSGFNHFKNDIKKWAEPSVLHSNTITIDKALSFTGKALIINLDKDANYNIDLTGDVQNIPADSVLRKEHFTTILKHDGPVLLYSSDPGLSARIWMLLSQMGRNNIFIITNKSDNEVLKYKFRPDTSLN